MSRVTANYSRKSMKCISLHVNGCFVFYCVQVLDYISLPAEGGDAAVFCLCVFMFVMCVTSGHSV